MPCEDVLGNRLALLREIVRDGFDEAPAQVQGFVVRVLDRQNRYAGDAPLYQEGTVEAYLDAVRFDGYPALARVGYRLACSEGAPLDAGLIDRFMQCIDQQRGRPTQRQMELAHDALSLLGIADGLRAVAKQVQPDAKRLDTAKIWVRQLLEKDGASDIRLGRARLVASDLLDEQGRFGRRLVQSDDTWVAALDLCLWRRWADVLRSVEPLESEQQRELLKTLLTAQPPSQGEPLHAATWLCALDVLTDEIAAALVPNANQVVRILAETQGRFPALAMGGKSEATEDDADALADRQGSGRSGFPSGGAVPVFCGPTRRRAIPSGVWAASGAVRLCNQEPRPNCLRSK